MSGAGLGISLAFAYVGLLFALALYADRRAAAGRRLVDHPLVYTLSLAVYCTAWTFYGSVGLAANRGLAFLPVYLGPTIVALLFPLLHAKILRVTRAYGLTSIADLLAARYGKSGALGALVTLVMVVGTTPYIALQLKAVAASLTSLFGAEVTGILGGIVPDLALLVALALGIFAILFGTRHIDATEHHEGMVFAIAFESLVKLATFLAVGAFVTWGIHGGLSDILARAEDAGLDRLLLFGATRFSWTDWFGYTLLSGLAFIVLPRMFQVAVIENVRIGHLRPAAWLFPLYLLLINLFVLPVALAGRLAGAGGDMLMIELPLSAGSRYFALLAFLGGLSAATAMVIVATVALATMISNDLVMPLLLRSERLGLQRRPDLSGLVLGIRRAAILLVMLAGYGFFRLAPPELPLVQIGLISFVAVAQVAPALLLGLYWHEARLAGALGGILAGMGLWAWTLVVPLLADAGWLSAALLHEGPFGIGLLRPRALFGLEGLDPVTHAVIWSLGANLAVLVTLSLVSEPTPLERVQAFFFVDVHRGAPPVRAFRGEIRVAALQELLVRFLGPARATAFLARIGRMRGREIGPADAADPELVEQAERELARAIGATSARLVLASIVRGEVLDPRTLLAVLDETSRAMEYAQRLEEKSRELERVAVELRAANERLRELDRLKDEFLATVSHELRTPLTAIRSFAEILRDHPDLPEEERQRFVAVIAEEAERLSRLVDDILDLSRLEAGRMEWHVRRCDLRELVEKALERIGPVLRERGVVAEADLAVPRAPVACDPDRLLQVLLNLLNNAAKFVPAGTGRIRVELRSLGGTWLVRVEDNGPGVPPELREAVFEKFRQAPVADGERPSGSGLGLAICREILRHFGGRIWCEDSRLGGAAFCFTLPAAPLTPSRAGLRDAEPAPGS